MRGLLGDADLISEFGGCDNRIGVFDHSNDVFHIALSIPGTTHLCGCGRHLPKLHRTYPRCYKTTVTKQISICGKEWVPWLSRADRCAHEKRADRGPSSTDASWEPGVPAVLTDTTNPDKASGCTVWFHRSNQFLPKRRDTNQSLPKGAGSAEVAAG